MALTPDSLRQLLHGVDPYAGFDAGGWPLDYEPDFDGASPILAAVAAELAPNLIVEVGTWKGRSAVTMARAVPTGIVCCIDTFLGSVEHWQSRTGGWSYSVPASQWRHGRLTVYEQFLANVIHEGLTERVIPFAITSDAAAKWLAMQGARPGLVYVDAAHDETSVRRDLEAYWPLIVSGGALVGHDYGGRHTGVKLAVDRWAERHGRTVCELGRQFYRIDKPKEAT